MLISFVVKGWSVSLGRLRWQVRATGERKGSWGLIAASRVSTWKWGWHLFFLFIIQLRVLDDGKPARTQCRNPYQGDGRRGLMFLHVQPWDVKGQSDCGDSEATCISVQGSRQGSLLQLSIPFINENRDSTQAASLLAACPSHKTQVYQSNMDLIWKKENSMYMTSGVIPQPIG